VTSTWLGGAQKMGHAMEKWKMGDLCNILYISIKLYVIMEYMIYEYFDHEY
jgi:hypothetical protein